MNSIDVLANIEGYTAFDDERLAQILAATFEDICVWERMNPNGVYSMHERTAVYSREGLTAVRRTEWHKDWVKPPVYTRDEIALTGKKKDKDAYIHDLLKLYGVDAAQEPAALKLAVNILGTREEHTE